MTKAKMVRDRLLIMALVTTLPRAMPLTKAVIMTISATSSGTMGVTIIIMIVIDIGMADVADTVIRKIVLGIIQATDGPGEGNFSTNKRLAEVKPEAKSTSAPICTASACCCRHFC